MTSPTRSDAIASSKTRLPDIAAEALYWQGLSKDKRTSDGAALGETARAMLERFPDSVWMKKAYVWEG